MSDCVRFKGHLRKQDGYGIVGRSRNGHQRIFMAHRWVWAEANDKDPWQIPRWVKITQSCHNKWCVNPEHLAANITALQQDALPGILDVSKPDVQAPALQSQEALAQSLKTECMLGHPFRTEPDDTPCTQCIFSKNMDKRFGINQVPATT